jgi:hypothetical protein
MFCCRKNPEAQPDLEPQITFTNDGRKILEYFEPEDKENINTQNQEVKYKLCIYV